MERFQLRSQLENNIVHISILESVCGIMDEDNPAGAQTERRGDAGPVRLLLGGETRRPTLFELLTERFVGFGHQRHQLQFAYIQLQQFGDLDAETLQLLILRLVLVGPGDSLVVATGFPSGLWKSHGPVKISL
jgi:hypothetical protein